MTTATTIMSANPLASLDMLTIVLVLIVGGAFLLVLIANHFTLKRVRATSRQTKDVTNIIQHALTIGNVNVLRMNMGTQRVVILYGNIFNQKDMTIGELAAKVHDDDRLPFETMLKRLAQRKEQTATLELQLNTGGNGQQPLWRIMNCYATVVGDSTPARIVCTMTDETEDEQKRRQEEMLAEKYRRIFNQGIGGLAFFDRDGMLVAANSYMHRVLHFQEDEDPLFFKTSIFNMPMFRDIIDRKHIDDMYFCSRSIIPERGVNIYLVMRIHPIYDAEGNLVNIAIAMRDITEERDIYLKLKENGKELQAINDSISGYEQELVYLMENCEMRVWKASFDNREITFHKTLSKAEKRMSLDELKEFFIEQKAIVGRYFDAPEQHFNKPRSFLCHMKPVFHDNHDTDWNIMDSVPVYDENGRLEGCFGTLRNVTALINAQERLREETRRAQDSGRQKSVFMANMTHEIRTPLNSIVGFSDVLPMMSTAEEKQEILKVIMNNCDMLLRLINDILEISKMDSSELAFLAEETDFPAEFDKVCRDLEQRVQQPGVTFIKENPETSLTMYTDMQRVKQIMTNFVTNAVKYTTQGHIKLGYRREGDGIYLYCEDTGAGIPKEKQAVVFERFVKLNDFVQGTGLGLSICSAIARKAGGRIGVESEGEGKGSTFWVWLPLGNSQENSKA